MKRIIFVTLIAGLLFAVGCSKQAELDKIDQLQQENEELEKDLSKLQKKLDKAEAKIDSLKEKLSDAKDKYDEAKTAARKSARLAGDEADKTLADAEKKHAAEMQRQKDDHEKTLAQLNEQIRTLAARVQNLQQARQAPAANDANDTTDPAKLDKILKVYRHYWGKVKSELATGAKDPEYLKDLQKRNAVSANYMNLIAQANKIARLTKNNTAAAGQTKNKLEALYTDLAEHMDAGSPWNTSTYKRLPSKRMSYVGVTVRDLAGRIVTELKEQQKQIANIETNKVRGSRYTAKRKDDKK